MGSHIIFEKYTDFISEKQLVQYWGFDFIKLKILDKNGDYSMPVRIVLFSIFKIMSESHDKRIRLRHFTVWIGDYGDSNQYFCIAIPYRMDMKIVNIFNKNFKSMSGFMFWNYDRLPAVSLIPVYRYEYGKIIEYTYERSLAGKHTIDVGEEGFNTGLTIQYREWESAEGFETRQVYKG